MSYTPGSPIIRSLAVPAVHATDTPAGSAKITLEGLEHWRTRLGRDVEQMEKDIAASEALAEKWCTKLDDGSYSPQMVSELKELKAKKVRRFTSISARARPLVLLLSCKTLCASRLVGARCRGMLAGHR